MISKHSQGVDAVAHLPRGSRTIVTSDIAHTQSVSTGRSYPNSIAGDRFDHPVLEQKEVACGSAQAFGALPFAQWQRFDNLPA
jgi:hypothetical protein